MMAMDDLRLDEVLTFPLLSARESWKRRLRLGALAFRKIESTPGLIVKAEWLYDDQRGLNRHVSGVKVETARLQICITRVPFRFRYRR